MAPKSKTAVVAAPKPTYKDMIKSAIVTLKERNGSSPYLPIDTNENSRQAIKKYVQSNFDVKTGNFDALFNTALRKGVDAGDFAQPKGPSGPVKVKVIAKPTAKPASKPVVKSVSKPVAKKVVKKLPVKKTTAKPLAKKVGKKTSAKPTKTTAKKVVKPTKKPAAKKKVTKK